MVQDSRERWWSKHPETGEWYYYDGATWVQDTPPGYEETQSEGPRTSESPTVEVPDLTGQQPPQARSELAGASLSLGGQNVAPSDTVPQGRIFGQEPAARTNAEQGSSVSITVSSGPRYAPPQSRRPARGVIVAISAVAALIVAVLVIVAVVVVIWLASSGGSTEFVIRDELAPEQVGEEVTVLIDGRNVGTLSVDQNNRTDEIDVSVDAPGRYSYTASADAVFQDQAGQFELSGTGQGTIEVSDGKVFVLGGTFSGSTWQISLVEQ